MCQRTLGSGRYSLFLILFLTVKISTILSISSSSNRFDTNLVSDIWTSNFQLHSKGQMSKLLFSLSSASLNHHHDCQYRITITSYQHLSIDAQSFWRRWKSIWDGVLDQCVTILYWLNNRRSFVGSKFVDFYQWQRASCWASFCQRIRERRRFNDNLCLHGGRVRHRLPLPPIWHVTLSSLLIYELCICPQVIVGPKCGMVSTNSKH